MKIRRPKKTVVFKGARITVYSIGWLAFLTHRSTVAVRRWQRIEVLPPPTLNLNGDRRWYTADELNAYTRIFRKAEVKTGHSIHATSFQKDAWAFATKYRDMLERELNPKLLAALPEEESIERAFRINTEQKIREEASVILREQLESESSTLNQNESTQEKEGKPSRKLRNGG